MRGLINGQLLEWGPGGGVFNCGNMKSQSERPRFKFRKQLGKLYPFFKKRMLSTIIFFKEAASRQCIQPFCYISEPINLQIESVFKESKALLA